METILNPAALPDSTPAVIYDPKSETVTIQSKIVSVAGVTVVTGGTELSWGSCMLAFGFWGTLIGLSMVSVGLWEYSEVKKGSTSHLLVLGLVVLGLSFSVVAGVVGLRCAMRKRGRTRIQRDEGRVVLVEGEGGVQKIVTV
ncbi:uncharacterized protein LOC143473813 [Brachyhypopomus gauderio]|uniref:uncharacterized protein LOC143473813 n=1 Tax=Brachyhypopomus gauderio TaxID=698409 RepID=UPI00404259F6